MLEYDNVNMTLSFSIGLGYELANYFFKHKHIHIEKGILGLEKFEVSSSNPKLFGGSPLYRLGFHTYFNHFQVKLGLSSSIKLFGYTISGIEKIGFTEAPVSSNISFYFYCSYTHLF